MSFLTIDFETFYDKDTGFKKQTTEEYIRDPRFEVIGVAVKEDDGDTKWFSGNKDELKSWLNNYDWKNSAVLAHNMLFDGAILAWHFGIVPAFYMDTLCMSRALHGVDAGGSLKSLAERYKLGVKGDDALHAEGKRRADFSPAELAKYGEYCVNDVALTYDLFNIISQDFPESELELIDMTLRMYTDPQLLVDDALLNQKLEELKEEKNLLLSGLKGILDVGTEEEVRKKLASNKQFAEVLESMGVPAPKKTSPTTGKETFALAKNDEGFIALQEHPDPEVQQLCSVRLGTKSTIEESRIERFIDTAARNKGKLPIPLKYYGAHTGRWSGMDAINLQNLPSRDKKKKTLKRAIRAPKDHYVVNSDSSQIEARVLAWWAGQDEVVQAFANKEDLYCLDASKVYGRTITKADPVERFVGKTMRLGLGYGTGAAKLRHTLKTQPPGADLSEDECKRLVDTWRESNDKIVDLWHECDKALNHLASWPEDGNPYYLGEHKCVVVDKQGIRLPNGLYIRYPGLRLEDHRYVYNSRKGTVSLWGGAVVENVVQALARIIIGQQMIHINNYYRVVLTVHDAAVCIISTRKINEAVETITRIMSTPPEWATGLPVTCEVKFAENYGDC